jgi:hypothetical protein
MVVRVARQVAGSHQEQLWLLLALVAVVVRELLPTVAVLLVALLVRHR